MRTTMMHDGGGSEEPVKEAITVADAKTAGSTGDYSNLSKIMKDPAAYQAFKDARLERVKAERIASTPVKTITPIQNGPVHSTITGGGGGGGGNDNKPTATPPTPTVANTVAPTSIPKPPAKTAPIDTVLFNDDSIPIEVMTDLIFEDIGGQELINIARNDIINGQKISYNPIKNLSSIQERYNPNNIVSLQSTSDKLFANFSIKLNEKIPNVGNGLNGNNVYFDELTGDLIIETINNENDEQLEIQITIGGTIYEADI